MVVVLMCSNENKLSLTILEKGRETRGFDEEGAEISLTEALPHHSVKVTVSISIAQGPTHYCSLRAAAGLSSSSEGGRQRS